MELKAYRLSEGQNLALIHGSMDPVQAIGGGVIAWAMFSWHTLGSLVPIIHQLHIAADHLHPFMATIYHLLVATFNMTMHQVPKHKFVLK